MLPLFFDKLTIFLAHAILPAMNIWWSDSQDKYWSRRPWSKRIDEDSKHIHWVLETCTEYSQVFMGHVHIHGTLDGDLTLAIKDSTNKPLDKPTDLC